MKMLEWLLITFEKIGTFAGWFVAIIQPPIWIVTVIKAKRRERAAISELQKKIRELNDENAEYKDKAYQWSQILNVLLIMTRFNCKPVFRKFVNLYGGEGKFKTWWVLPDIPELKKEE